MAVDGSDRYPAIRQQYAKRIIIYFRRNVMKETHYTSPYELEGRLPLGEAVLLGLQHVLAILSARMTSYVFPM